jgi:hypothetical protein
LPEEDRSHQWPYLGVAPSFAEYVSGVLIPWDEVIRLYSSWSTVWSSSSSLLLSSQHCRNRRPLSARAFNDHFGHLRRPLVITRFSEVVDPFFLSWMYAFMPAMIITESRHAISNFFLDYYFIY